MAFNLRGHDLFMFPIFLMATENWTINQGRVEENKDSKRDKFGQRSCFLVPSTSGVLTDKSNHLLCDRRTNDVGRI